MIAYVEVPSIVDNIEHESHLLSEQIAAWLPLQERPEQLINGTDLFTIATGATVYILKGVFKYYYGNKLIRLYGSGDIVQLPSLPDAHGCRCLCEFGATVHILTDEVLTDNFVSNAERYTLFLKYQSLQSALLHILCATYTPDDIHPDITIRNFDTGTVIIAEGDPAREIYQMIQGSATVTVGGTAVGVIEEGEVFGEISFFTENTRTATVIAKSECLVQVMNKDDFIAMIKLKPSINLSISRTLSHRLVEANKKVAGDK